MGEMKVFVLTENDARFPQMFLAIMRAMRFLVKTRSTIRDAQHV